MYMVIDHRVRKSQLALRRDSGMEACAQLSGKLQLFELLQTYLEPTRNYWETSMKLLGNF